MAGASGSGSELGAAAFAAAAVAVAVVIVIGRRASCRLCWSAAASSGAFPGVRARDMKKAVANRKKGEPRSGSSDMPGGFPDGFGGRAVASVLPSCCCIRTEEKSKPDEVARKPG